MKTILLLLFVIPSLTFGQTFYDDILFDTETGAVRFERIIETNGNKDALFSKTKIWLADIFKNSKTVIQTEDKSEGYITGKALLSYSFTQYSVKKKKITESPNWPNKADFTFKIFVKDNKAKIIITNIVIHGLIEYFNYEWSKGAVIYTQKQLKDADLEEVAKGKSKESEYQSLIYQVAPIMSSFQNSLQKKDESDF